jgi:hypothetical protein
VTACIRESNLPQFPTEVIKGLAKDFVNLYKNKREVPDELLWASFVAYFGNIISPYASLKASSTSEPRLYVANLGRSGRTKKSTALNAARDFVGKLFPDEQDNHIRIIEGFGSAEGLVTQLEACDSRQIPAIVHLDEINVLASKTGMDGSVGISLLNKLFEDQHYEHPLRDRNTRIKNARLSLVGASTLEDYQKTWSGKHKDTGFFSRLFIVPAEPSSVRIPVPISPDPAHFEDLLRRTRQRIQELKTRPIQLEIDADAELLWNKFYAVFGDGDEWNRIDVYAFRLMTLQATITGTKSITKEIMEDIIKLSEYQTAARLSVSPVIAENQCAVVEQLIRRVLPEGVTLSKRDLQRKINADRYGVQNFRNALRNLESTQEITSLTRGKTVLYKRVEDPEDSGFPSSVIKSNDDSAISLRAA